MVNNIWRHKKTGNLYIILADDMLIESTMERAICYVSLHDNRKWIRPHKEFYDGRFEVLNSMEFENGVVRLSHSDAF